MKTKLFFYACLMAMTISSCSKDEKEGGNEFTPTELTVTGKVEKGPFVSGSTINMQPLNQEMNAVGSTYTSTITDDAGSFTFSAATFEQPYARLSVDGYFYNEYRGELSKGTLTLQGVVDLRDKKTVNVNLLTHLKYQRVLNLISGGKSFTDANTQAQEELFKAFGLQKFNTADASQFSVAAGTDEAAALIVFSSILLSKRTEAQFTEYLARLSADFADDGQFTETNKKQLNDDRDNVFDKLNSIRQHLIDRYKSLGKDIQVKDLSAYADWDGNGTAGDEAHDPSKPINLSQTALQVPVEGGSYQITFNSDVPLYLTQRGSQYDATPETISLCVIGGISATKEIKGNKVLITVAPAECIQMGRMYIPLYDFLGNKVADIEISQAGKPDGEFLSSNGIELFESIAQQFKNGDYWGIAFSVRESLNLLNYNKEMVDVAVYHLDDVLRVYRALAWVKTGYTEVETGTGRASSMVFEEEIKQAIANLGNHVTGNCETPRQTALLSADVARYTLAKIYIMNSQNRNEAINLLQQITDSQRYNQSRNVILGFNGTVIVDYNDILSLLSQR